MLLNDQYHAMICCTCKVQFAIDGTTYTVLNQQKEKGTFYCPHGHAQHFATGETELQKAQREASRLRQQIAQRDDEIKELEKQKEHEKRSAIAYKGKVTELKNRAAAGVCPCCNRTFVNMARHMESQHPDFKKEVA